MKNMSGTPKKLILIRHAESEKNKAANDALFTEDPSGLESLSKIPDHKINLTNAGILQARETSKHLKELIGTPDVLFHSGYQRTRQTTTELLTAYENNSIPIKEHLSLRERESGYTHVLLEADKNLYFPYIQHYWDIVGGLFARPVGGESLMDVIEQRLKPFLKELYTTYEDKTVVLVTHGRIIQCFRFILDEMTWEEMEEFLKGKNAPKNASVTIYTKNEDSGKLTLEAWNNVLWTLSDSNR